MKLYICEDFKTAKWRKYILSDKKLSLAFAKKCLCDYIGEKEEDIEVVFAKNEYGKPYMESIYKTGGKTGKIKMDTALFFSVSHSENMIICAVACFNAGADCQKKNTDDAAECRKIAARFFSAQENAFLERDKSERDYIDNFFTIWTKKEAYIKYTGKGLAEGLDTFSVTTEKRHKSFLNEVCFKSFDIKNDFYVYLCYNKDNKNVWEKKYFN